MKFSFRQILASVAGAVLAALIASSFGVTGTIIGVAIGSAAATIGTALISHSIERGQHAVKQVAVRVPEGSTSTLLRRLGGTVAAGGVAPAPDDAAPTEVVGRTDDETAVMESSAAAADETEHLEISAAIDAPATERLEASTVPVPVVPATARGRRFAWPAIAGTAAIVFVLALVFVTVVELIADRPLASIFGQTGTGPTIKNIISPPAATTSTTTTTTTPASSTTSTTGSTTTTTSSSTTTTTPSTTGLSGTTTTTTPGATTTAPGSSTTTTTAKP